MRSKGGRLFCTPKQKRSPGTDSQHVAPAAGDSSPDVPTAQLAEADVDDLVLQTIEVWQPRSERRLTPEDAREIISNASGFFRVLAEWDRRSSEEAERQPEETVNHARG